MAERVFGGKPVLITAPPAETEMETEMRYREPSPDELVLGWAQAVDLETDTNIFQLKGIKQEDRESHFYVIGASGTGKTRFLEYLIQQDIKNGEGFGVVDPHGDLIEDVKGWLLFAKHALGKDLKKDVVLIEPTDPKKTIIFNPLEKIKGIEPYSQAKELVEAFHKIWEDSWGPRMEDILRTSLIALIENETTLIELPKLLTDPLARKKILENVKDPNCLDRFEFYASLSPAKWREWIESTLNKVNAFLSDTRIRQMFSGKKSSFNLRKLIDEKKVILVNLDRGRLKGSSDLLGSLLLSKIQMAAFSRTDILEGQRVPFYLYIDEFQNFATQNFIETLSQARKYKLSLILAHQNLSQLPPELRGSLLANCAVQSCFRVSRDDAQIMAKELLTSLYTQPPGWEPNVQTLQDLPARQCFVKNKHEGGVIMIYTPEMPLPWKLAKEAEGELDGITEESFQKSVKQAKIGAGYLKSRKKIEKEYLERRETLKASPEPESFREKKKKSAVVQKKKK